MAESKTQVKERTREVVNRLKREYPDSACSLNYSSRHELLVATILSAQCTDERVNKTTVALFEKYKFPQDFAYANPDELSQDIRSCGYHNQKARSIQGASLRIVEEHGGEVPDTLTELVSLPGVGRKTANCVLGECFGEPAMVIDTHMVRIMNLLGFATSRKPDQIERELMIIFERPDWVMLTHMIIDHGRAVCIARRPQCQNCVLSDLCPAASVY
ncbi:MAG: endonuclease III [Candidatus Marinimicrobia bacterium]|nr:endonuclease III [Candidatus Neomarinimicrobiota bacterium]